MIYVLDTNIVSQILKRHDAIRDKIETLAFEGHKIAISAISYYEIKRGLIAAKAAAKLRKFEKLCTQFGLLLLDDREVFDVASKIWADLKERGQIVNDADILIAASVRRIGAILVSHHKDFRRIPNLHLEDWLD